MDQEPEPELIENIIPHGAAPHAAGTQRGHLPLADRRSGDARILLLRRQAAERPALLQLSLARRLSAGQRAPQTASRRRSGRASDHVLRSRTESPEKSGAFFCDCACKPTLRWPVDFLFAASAGTLIPILPSPVAIARGSERREARASGGSSRASAAYAAVDEACPVDRDIRGARVSRRQPRHSASSRRCRREPEARRQAGSGASRVLRRDGRRSRRAPRLARTILTSL